MRSILLTIAMVATSQAAEPPAPAENAATTTSTTTTTTTATPAAPAAAAAPAKATAAEPKPGDADRVAYAKRMGYKITNERGETMFCQRETKTGTHIRGEMVCMTAAEMDQLRTQSQQALQRFMNTQISSPHQ